MNTLPEIMLVAGARPNFMKIAPLHHALARAGVRSVIVHTGQHYDDSMSGAFFDELEIPEPDHRLGIGSGSHAQQTARVMSAFEPVLLAVRPHWMVVVGDVNSTLACALVAVKLKEQTGTRIAHVEAGLRSGDWRMPEEINRILTDRISDLLFTTSHDALLNLRAEGIAADRVRFAGNVMVDTLLHQLERARQEPLLDTLGLIRGRFVLVTLHRPSNVDDAPRLGTLLAGLNEIARDLPVVFPMHPRTRGRIDAFGLAEHLDNLKVLEPVGYRQMLALTDGAACVLTDSGGLQEESTTLGVPCVTLRETTERPVTITHGTNVLVPWPLTARGVVDAFRASSARRRVEGVRPDGWDGRAAERIVEALLHDRPPTIAIETATEEMP